jgi:seryl-tRNA synthetase
MRSVMEILLAVSAIEYVEFVSCVNVADHESYRMMYQCGDRRRIDQV